MKKYSTSQRKILIDFLSKNNHSQLSAKEIYTHIKDDGISLSAIYRNLPVLEKEGIVNRVVKADSKKTLYQIFENKECNNSIHLFCEKCGKTFHMDGKVLDNLCSEVKKKNKFSVDTSRTTIYGVCDECSIL